MRQRPLRPQLKRDPLDGGSKTHGAVTTISTPVLRRLGSALLLGAISGALFLGVGSRFVMRLFALATTRSAGFTLRGSLNVVFAGAIAGAVGSVLLIATDRFMPKRLWVRALSFAALCYLIATPGFRPPQLLVFALFAPAFLAYGVVLEVFWERFERSRRLTSA